MTNTHTSKRYRNTWWRLFAIAPLVASATLVHMAAPAGANTIPETIGAGLVSGYLPESAFSSAACTLGASHTYLDAALSGVTVGHNDDVLVGSTGFTTPLLAQALGDPLDGTPLGCRHGDVAQVLFGGQGGAGYSNALGEVGVVTASDGSSNIGCDAKPHLPAAVPPGSFVVCSVRGTYVRYGGATLMFLNGCVDVATDANPTCFDPGGVNEDVAVAFHLAPLPYATDCATVSTALGCSLIAGSYLVTPHGMITGGGGVIQSVIDSLYCPFGNGHVFAAYPPDPHCN